MADGRFVFRPSLRRPARPVGPGAPDRFNAFCWAMAQEYGRLTAEAAVRKLSEDEQELLDVLSPYVESYRRFDAER
jgi:hypothetical protein